MSLVRKYIKAVMDAHSNIHGCDEDKNVGGFDASLREEMEREMANSDGEDPKEEFDISTSRLLQTTNRKKRKLLTQNVEQFIRAYEMSQRSTSSANPSPVHPAVDEEDDYEIYDSN